MWGKSVAAAEDLAWWLWGGRELAWLPAAGGWVGGLAAVSVVPVLWSRFTVKSLGREVEAGTSASGSMGC